MNIFRLILYPFSLLYGLITGLRNLLFNAHILPSTQFPLWVISIGNLSAGGTGKTPHTEYLARLLAEMSKQHENLKITYENTAVLSRGYGRKSRGFLMVHGMSLVIEVGDEPLQLRRRLNDIIIAVDRIRRRGIGVLISLNRQLRLVLLDDAFQHRWVKPDISILLTNYNSPFYSDHLLPAGNLREWKGGYKRANIIIVTSAPANLSDADKNLIIKNIAPALDQKILFSSITYGEPIAAFKSNLSPVILNKDLSVLLVTGIANPSEFKNYLSGKVKEVHSLPFNDHRNYTQKDITKVLNAFRKIANPNKVIITTEKDYVRLDVVEIKQQLGDTPVFFVPINVYVHEEKELKDAIFKHLSNTALYQPPAKVDVKLQKLA